MIRPTPEQIDAMTPADAVDYAREHFGVGVAEALAEVLAPAPHELTTQEREYVTRNVDFWKSQASVIGMCGACVVKLGDWTTRLLELECAERARYAAMSVDERREYNEQRAAKAELTRWPRRGEDA